MYEEGFRVQGCGGGFAANIYRAMPESSIQATSHKSLVTSHSRLLIPSHSSPLSHFFGVSLSCIVIPSAAEGSFLHCGQYHIGTNTETVPGCYVFLLSHIHRLSVCKEDFSLALEMTIRDLISLSRQSPNLNTRTGWRPVRAVFLESSEWSSHKTIGL